MMQADVEITAVTLRSGMKNRRDGNAVPYFIRVHFMGMTTFAVESSLYERLMISSP